MMSSWIFSQLYWRDDERVVYRSIAVVIFVVVVVVTKDNAAAAAAVFLIEIEIDQRVVGVVVVFDTAINVTTIGSMATIDDEDD